MDTRRNKISLTSATAIVVANMIGAGVFTSLGFQLEYVSNSWSIVFLWVLGAVMAICGAVSYAEIGTELRRSGGEYHFLSELFHPVLGYLSGWISMTVGFAAPVALSAIALAQYTTNFHNMLVSHFAILVVLLISIIHLTDLEKTSKFQIFTTSVKVLLLISFIVCGLLSHHTPNAMQWDSSWTEELLLPGFAVSLIYVSFSYSGWNAAAYITEEIERPHQNLPRALVIGTCIVSIVYVLLNICFLKNASMNELAGQLEVGQIASVHIFGKNGGQLMSIAIGIMLISSISAMVWAGPRVIFRMAEDYRIWRFLSLSNKRNIPVMAVIFQSLISIVLILTGTFEQILIYCGFLLNFFSGITVAGSFVARRRGLSPNTFKSPLFPFPQMIFLILSLWIMVYLIIQQPFESLYGILNILIGLVSYFISKKMKNESQI